MIPHAREEDDAASQALSQLGLYFRGHATFSEVSSKMRELFGASATDLTVASSCAEHHDGAVRFDQLDQRVNAAAFRLLADKLDHDTARLESVITQPEITTGRDAPDLPIYAKRIGAKIKLIIHVLEGE